MIHQFILAFGHLIDIFLVFIMMAKGTVVLLLVFSVLTTSCRAQLVLVSPNETVLSQMDDELTLNCSKNLNSFGVIEACRWIRRDFNEFNDPFYPQYTMSQDFDCKVSTNRFSKDCFLTFLVHF